MAELWKGAPVAAALTERMIPRVQALRERGVVPTLAIVRVGEQPGDISYEAGAVKRCAKVGVEVRQYRLPARCSTEQLWDTIRQINRDSAVHGCLLFRPLPDRDMEDAACALLDPAKDVDGMTRGALASIFAGRGPGCPPCTAQACLELLDYYGVDLTGKRVTVIGRSLVVGKPVSMLLQARDATVTMCHTKTRDLPDACRGAEILIAAAGKAGVVTREHVSPGQAVLDVGVNVDENGKLCGDVDFDAVEPVVSAVTPVPGGVGAVTTAVLCKHVISCAERAWR